MSYVPKENKFFITQVVKSTESGEYLTVRGIAEYQTSETEYFCNHTVDSEEEEYYWIPESELERF